GAEGGKGREAAGRPSPPPRRVAALRACKGSTSSRAHSRADFVSRPPTSSCSRPQSCSADSQSILEGFYGCVERNVIAPKSISANSLKAIWSCTLSTGSEDFAGSFVSKDLRTL